MLDGAVTQLAEQAACMPARVRTRSSSQLALSLVSPDAVYVQSNQFARGTVMSQTTVHTHRLLAAALAKVDRNGSAEPKVELTAEELREIFPAYAKNQALGLILDQETDNLMALRVETRVEASAGAAPKRGRRGPLSFDKINVIGRCTFAEGTLSIEFHPKVSQHIIGLRNNYTYSRLRYIARFSSEYQHKLYNALVSYSVLGDAQLEVEDLRTLLGVKPAMYAQFKDFKKRVLDPSVEAINEYSDLKVAFGLVRKSKKVIAVTFKIRRKEQQQQLGLRERGLGALMVRFGMAQRYANECLTLNGFDYCCARYVVARVQRDLQQIKQNPGGYLYALCEDRTPPKADSDRHAAMARQVRLDVALEVYTKLLEPDQKAAVDAAFLATLENHTLVTCFTSIGHDHHSVKERFNAFITQLVFQPMLPNSALSS